MAKDGGNPHDYPTAFERAILEKGDEWFAGILTPADPPRPVPEAEDPRLLLVCMTPRSGSTALSGALAATRRLGWGGERLNRRNKVMAGIVRDHRPATRRELLDRVIDAARTRNGVSQIKCDLPQVLPFLLDRDCAEVLRRARFVYLTRADVLGQAISRHRATTVKVQHARKGREVSAVEAPYDFGAILAHLERLTRMMAAYEKVFAMMAVRPLRITYEDVTARPREVIEGIAGLVGVTLDREASLEAGGYRKVASGDNDSLRARFLAECGERMFHT